MKKDEESLLLIDERNPKDKHEDDLPSDDIIKDCIGNFGPWQFKVALLMSLLKFPIAWYQLGIVFLAPPTTFWCARPLEYQNVSVHNWLQMVNPNQTIHNKKLSPLHGSCEMLDLLKLKNNSQVYIPCPFGYEYNRRIIHSSIITEWDLVCSRAKLIDLAQIVLMFGVLLGNIMFGVSADKYGRKRILVVAIAMQTVFGVVEGLAPWYSLFLMARFLTAFANGGTMVASFVICMEVVGGTWRTIVPILYQIPFGLGNTIMAAVAYFLRDWRVFQTTLAGVSASYLVYALVLPESPRWLLAVGRFRAASSVLERAAEQNKQSVPVVRRIVRSLEIKGGDTARSKPSLGVFWRSKKLRLKTMLLCLQWLICGISFYGFSQYMGQVTVNIYLTVALGGVIAVPGTLLCVLVVRRFGRRTSIASAYIYTGTCYLLILTIPVGTFRHDWPRVLLAGLGVIGMSVSMPALYLFTGELYPTVVRNAGVGICVMCSRIGSMVAPLVISTSSHYTALPLLILGTLVYLKALLILPLPETKDCTLSDSVNDYEHWNRK